MSEPDSAQVLVKFEGLNVGGSIKTRTAYNMITQAEKKGKILTFHWRGGYLTKEVLGELFELIGEEAKKKDKFARVSLNWAQAVLQVRFETELPETQFEMEEANEGEKES